MPYLKTNLFPVSTHGEIFLSYSQTLNTVDSEL